MRKVKKEKLETIYTPTFEPKINHSRKMVQNFNTKKLKENIIDTEQDIKIQLLQTINDYNHQLISRTLDDDSI